MQIKVQCEEAGARVHRTQPEENGPIEKKLVFYAKFARADAEEGQTLEDFADIIIERFTPM